VIQADYGIVSVSTAPGASCTAGAVLSDGTSVAGLGGPRTADDKGKVVWVYLQVPVAANHGVYTIRCSAGSLQASVTANFQPGD
jgi:hypothetical protein